MSATLRSALAGHSGTRRPRLLLINPNTTPSITAMLQRHIDATAMGCAEVSACTARFGAPYIADEASYAVAGHACLDAWANALATSAHAPDIVLIGCFGDPGLWALRASSAVPVTGLAEAALEEASFHGRFAIVTGGAAWEPILRRLAMCLGYGCDLAGVQTIALTGAEIATHPETALALLATACKEAVQKFDAQAVILGGAGLAGMATLLQAQLDVPLIDSVAAGARQALRVLHPATRPAPGGFENAWQNLSPEMTALGKR